MKEERKTKKEFSRRDFFQTAAVAGAGILLTKSAFAQDAASETADATGPAIIIPSSTEEVRVAIIGPGSQGRYLMLNALKIPGVKFVAVCDIWSYNQRYSANILKKYGHEVNVYEEYQEMLDKEANNLDAVIVATPDWMHSPITVACLKAGLHVYCEKEMSDSLEGARKMVEAAKETGKLLQIGHQRRSNPRYLHSLKLIEKDKVLGKITNVEGQWNREVREDLGWPEAETMDPAKLEKYGYENMHQFRNWRWYKKYSGGPISDLGSHQVDIFNWFLKATPKAVYASAGLDYYNNREWYDNVMTIYEWDTEFGAVRGAYQVLNTTSYGGFYEVFLGDEGSLVISEDDSKGFLYRERAAKKREWEDEASRVETMGQEAIALKIGETLQADGTKSQETERLLAEVQKPPLQLHLENFFGAIREEIPLTSSGEEAFQTTVSVLKVNESIEKGQRLEFSPEEFKV